MGYDRIFALFDITTLSNGYYHSISAASTNSADILFRWLYSILMIYQLYLLAATYLLLSAANCFALDGAWDLLPSPDQYKYILNPITLQFKRQASTDGTISN